uniref:MIP01424p n=1 Tax=Drosophila melanogaster TaxID=7227 RepID=B8A3Y3_DROME|nr:uncharacterized protein Dmel_CG43169 [Drosophila melanogaster]ACL68722.1 MIP01424p [Drosophila melanogaster]AFH04357.1 uncharacterized protein Dmel_CG43169 [Drosophila melanogaster]|eukprot:NP_001246686.1 uncharacterized protein Dmel_CG43169 [Drosophila melanogaster]
MFKELVLWMHHLAHDFCLARPMPPIPRHGCRVPVKNGFFANLIFFVAIVTPLYFCLLKDVIAMITKPKKR